MKGKVKQPMKACWYDSSKPSQWILSPTTTFFYKKPMTLVKNLMELKVTDARHCSLSLMITPRTRQTMKMMTSLRKSDFANDTLMNVPLSWEGWQKVVQLIVLIHCYTVLKTSSTDFPLKFRRNYRKWLFQITTLL